MNGPSSPARKVAIAALSVALGTVLHEVSLLKLPMGGSVTLASAVPIACAARMLGLRWGVFAGAALGALQAILHPFVVHPAQFLLDYPLAYGCLGLSALTPWPSVGLGLGMLARFACHVTSGVWFYWKDALAHHQGALAYSALYNSFLVPDTVLALLVLETLAQRVPALVGKDESPPAMSRWAIGAAVLLAACYSIFLARQVAGR